MTYVPSSVHPSIKWSKKDPMFDPIADDLPWLLVTKESRNISKDVPSTPLKSSKRKETAAVQRYGPPSEHRTTPGELLRASA